MRLGIDWGGTKIEIIALDDAGTELFRKRSATPKDDYEGCIRVVKDLVDAAESATGQTGSLGLGIPGSLSPKTGLVKNANSTWMNGKPLDKDLEAALNRPVRIQNDANCLAVSEATDGAGAGAHIVHAIIIGTGSGSGIAIDGKAHLGANGIGGEWGGIALPWMTAEEFPGPDSWIGHKGVIDLWCSGTGFQWDYKERTGTALKGHEIIDLKRSGDAVATKVYQDYVSRLARALAMSANLLDPDVFVLGGGMSNIAELYDDLPDAMLPYVFSDTYDTPIRKAKHGDSSGVRGAAWLWND
ncbi:ROK family protein [Roseibium alexandrii]|uniref:Transcriptional regulator/sugar kinase n=1 Tax=Roseibium alexandrii (strain DSM 17067 / NCIMB 14079 / DFL-11) TaxID=244592 RepID=A0A5E8H2D5_ROSAD|nr:ROK family protein [Roseibium alexandrii]EEE46530.1 Transcriptional regulator/sugar kinase [Roseibium alexandrii DFL-11]